ncbi:MAG: hypothetical protein L0271_06840 [Gemmatimonadetes bacterium]|nr:hypothetical protein [Gemmatimonadota bacterium]
MIYADASGPVLHPRVKRRLAALCALILAAWLFEFATHLHVPDTGGAPQHIEHACAFCAAFCAGTGPPESTPQLPLAQPARVGHDLSLIPPSLIRLAAYRSRAPPSLDLA